MRAVSLFVSVFVAAAVPAALASAQDSQAPASPAPDAQAQKAPTPAAKAPEPNNDVRISGVVDKFQGGLISISPSQGVTLTIRFDAGPGVNSMRKGKVSDLKNGQQVTAQAKSNPAGGLVASQVIIYEQGAESVAGTQASTDPSQVVAKLSEVTSTPDGAQLSLTYKDGERKLSLAKDVVIWIARPASADDIKPGSLITIAGRKPPEGEIKVTKASIGPAGAENPPL
jgi:glucose/arabinose dehydrogenase